MSIKREEILLDKKVKVVPVIRKGGWLPTGHDGEFMYTGCKRSYCLPYDVNKGRLATLLTKEEETFFENELSLDPGTLSVHNKKSNYWRQDNFHIDLDKEGIILDLNDPLDTLKFRCLKMQPEVAPSWGERYDSGEYKWALVDEGYEVEETSKTASLRLKAYKYFDKIQNSTTKMRNVLRVYGKLAAPNATPEFLISEIDKIINADKATLTKLIEIFEDKTFDAKLFVNQALDCNAIKKQGTKYMLPGGDIIGVGMDDTVDKILEFKKNGDPIYLTIAAKVDELNSKE